MIKFPARYSELKQTFSAGGMSKAYLCHDEHLDRDVIIKELQGGVEPRRLLDELSALLAIRSNHVVEIYDVVADESGKIVGIVEEFLPGDDLSTVKPPSDAAAALRLLYPIAAGIAEIHAHKRVHRDIKPTNMKYDAEGCLKIFDFGLSKLDSDPSKTYALNFTEGYAAPEFFSRSHGKIEFTRAVDTYAFGTTAVRLLLGKLPKQLRRVPPGLPCEDADFAKLPVSLPAEVATLLNACLSIEPAKRPLMPDVARAIEQHIIKNRHRALMVYKGTQYILAKDRPNVSLTHGKHASLRIMYDGLGFVLENIEGNVFVNNISVRNGFRLPGACVIVLGSSELGAERGMLTVDVSHPEVVL